VTRSRTAGASPPPRPRPHPAQRLIAPALALAIRQRYTLANVHHTYNESLRAVGAVLHDFLRGVQSLPPATPELRLPQQRKGDGLPAASPPPTIASSSSAAPPVAKQVRIAPDDGHIHFQSDDDSDSEGGHIKFHSDEEPDQAQRRPEVVRSAGAPPGPLPPQVGPPILPLLTFTGMIPVAPLALLRVVDLSTNALSWELEAVEVVQGQW